MKILVAEDEPMLREDIAMILEMEGHTIIQAQNGQEALEIITADSTLDLLFTDVKMPKMNGLELIATLRERNLGDFPVIVCSAYAMNQDIADAKKLGVRQYITKPFEFDDIINAVNSASMVN